MARRELLIGLAVAGAVCGLLLALAGQNAVARVCGVVLIFTNSYLALRYHQRQD